MGQIGGKRVKPERTGGRTSVR